MKNEIPSWATRYSEKLFLSAARVPKFNRGDIVMVDISREPGKDAGSGFYGGVGVVVLVFKSPYNTKYEYTINFGPKKGKSAWYPQNTLTLLRRA